MTESKNPYRSTKRQKSEAEADKYELPRWLYDKDGTLDKELAAEYSAKREELIEKIRAAFASVKRPAENQIGKGYSDFYVLDREFLPAFKGKSWDDISLETAVKYAPDFFQKFYAIGQHYFLPMFLIGMLRYPETLDIAFDYLIPYKPHHYWTDVADLLDATHKHVMVEFFKFLKFMFYDDDNVAENIKFWESTLLDIPPG